MFRLHYQQLVRASALYDLIVTAGFVTPWTFRIVHAALGALSPLPSFEPVHVLIANLLGSIVVVWSVLRLVRTDPVYGLFDSFARALFLTWQLYYLLAMQGAPVVWAFAVFEAAFGVTQAYGYWLLRKSESQAPTKCRIALALRAAA